LPFLSSTNGILDFIVFDYPSKEEKINQFKMLMKDPEVQPFFRNYIENIIATSELKILKRLALLEQKLDLADPDLLDEEEIEITIPEQLSLLAERIDNITEPVKTVSQPVTQDITVIPETKTEIRAYELVKHLQTNVKPRNNEIFMTVRECMNFIQVGIKTEYRVENVKNPRQVKKEVLEKAREMYSDLVSLVPKRNGNKEVRIVLERTIKNDSNSLKRKIKNDSNSLKRKIKNDSNSLKRKTTNLTDGSFWN